MTIKPQKEGEALEDRINGEEKEEEDKIVQEVLDSLPDPEAVEEPEEPIEAPVGPADFSSPSHVAPQVLEEAHIFLNKYGIMTEGLTPKEVMTKIQKIKVAKVENAQVLTRGRAIDGMERMLSFVPDGFVGEFKRENDLDISRAKALGFTVFESEEAKLESSTGTSDGTVRYGDQILMIIREELYVANRLIKAERLAARRRAHDPSKSAVDQEGADDLFPLIKL